MNRNIAGLVAGGLMLASSSTFAAGTGNVAFAVPMSLEPGLLLGCVYALVGTLLLIVCFKTFDKIMTRIDLEAEILKGNVAAGIFSAAVVIAIALIIAAAIS